MILIIYVYTNHQNSGLYSLSNRWALVFEAVIFLLRQLHSFSDMTHFVFLTENIALNIIYLNDNLIYTYFTLNLGDIC